MGILQLGDPRLRQMSESVAKEEIQGVVVKECIARMQQALCGIKSISRENGNAIAAPQVGLHKRIIQLYYENAFLTLINPIIVSASERCFDFVEECFSFYYLRGVVSRHCSIEVEYKNLNGGTHMITFEDEFSAIVQHEIDHLDGILFLDRMNNPAEVSSIDHFYKNEPLQLEKVKQLHAYMSSR